MPDALSAKGFPSGTTRTVRATASPPALPRGYFAIGAERISKALNLGNLMRSAHGFGASFTFTIGYVPAGNYRMAYTCDPDDVEIDANETDLPQGSDEVVELTPTDGVEVTVTAGETAQVDFPPL